MEYNRFLTDVIKDVREKEILEGIYDTDIFKELEKKISPSGKMSPEERERIAQQLATPDARPYDFDENLEAWLLRISIWGKIKITRKDPEIRLNKTLSTNEFLAYVDNKNVNAERGLWTVEEADINKIRFYRQFWSVLGKNVTEEIIVDIDLRQDLKNALKQARKKLGWFSR